MPPSDMDRYRLMIDHLHDAVLLIDPKQEQILEANRSACRVFGYTREELRASGISAIHPHVSTFRAFARAVLTRGCGRTAEMVYRTKADEQFTAEISAAPLELDGREYVLASLRNRAERRKSEAMLRKTTKAAWQSARANAVMAEIGRIISSTLDIDEVYERFAEQVRKLLPFDRMTISDVDLTAETLTPVYVAGLHVAGWEKGQTHPLSHSRLGPVAHERRSLLFNTASTLTHAQQHPNIAAGAKAGLLSGVAVPLISHGRLVGMLNLSSFEPDAYTWEDVHLTERVAAQIAGAVANSQLYAAQKRAEARIRREAARADALVRTAARLNAQLDPDAVLQAVCEETARALQVAAVAVLLYDETRQVLTPGATLGMPPAYSAEYEPTPRTLYDEYAQRHGPTIVVSDIQAVAGMPNVALYTRHDIRTTVITSLYRDQQLIGTLNIYTFERSRTFDEDELALLQGLADQAVQAIENARLYAQARRLAVLEERQRLSRELHDSVTQALYGMTLYTEAANLLLAADDTSGAAEYLHEMQNTAQTALHEMRLLIFQLRPPALEAGLATALRERLEAVEERSGLETVLRVEGEHRLPPASEEELYRIAQEALNNILKHAQAHTIHIMLEQTEQKTVLTITDDGVGFSPTEVEKRGGLGLPGMQERVAKLDGTLHVESQPGAGTRIRVDVPCP